MGIPGVLGSEVGALRVLHWMIAETTKEVSVGCKAPGPGHLCLAYLEQTKVLNQTQKTMVDVQFTILEK